ncbi:MAG TPA: tetratricopeptide repeat protein [Planctomycetota bacterium]|nr:tetratricopeptide repeat protein [Planctomycetota bacterium]
MPVSVRALAAALSLLAADLLTAQSERPPESFQLALGLQQRGLHEEAVRQFTEFLRQEPRHALAAEANYRLATSQLELDQKDAAQKSLEQALRLGGDGFRWQPECRYRLGNLLEAAGKHRAAGEQFEALAAAVPADHYLLAAARYAEGEAWRELGDDQRAAAAFTAAAAAAVGERASFRFPALYQLGFAQMRQQQLAEAAVTFTQAAASAPDDAAKGECHYLCGDLLLRRSAYDAAERAFTKSLEFQGEFADDAAFGLGWVALGRGDAKAARRAFAAVVERHAESPLVNRAKLEIGRSLYGDKSYAEAERTLQPLLDGNVAEDVRQPARELIGLCALASGAGQQALDNLQKALAEAAPADRPRLSFALGEAFANLSRWQEALAAYEQVPADAPAELRGDALYGACFALHSLGRHQESLARATALRALQPRHRLADQATFAAAENLFALEKYAEAERDYEAVVELPAHRTKAQWKLAWCRYLRGDKTAAATRFAAIAADAESPFTEEAMAMQSLASLEGGDADAALAVADRYRARYKTGKFLDRTERVAARVLRQKGDLAAAQKRLERAAAVATASGAADAAGGDVLEQAELAYLQGDYKAADPLFLQLAERGDATGARALAGRAWCAFELGDDAACAKLLGSARSHPAAAAEQPGLLELQSALHHRQKAWPEAIAVAKSFLEQFPKHSKAPAMRYALGTAQARNGEHAAARVTLEKLAADGGYERADRVYYELAWACRRCGDEPAALAAFGRVAADSKDEELAGEANLHLGAAALDAKDLAKARVLLRKVQGSHRGTALYRLGFAEFEAAGANTSPQDQLATARDLFGAIAAMPGETLAGEALYLGAECCHRLGDLRGASQRLQQLLELDPKHARADRARLLLGECAVGLGDGNAAVPVLEEYLRGVDRERTDEARAQLWLGRARMLRGEADKAEASLQRVTELSDGPLAAEAQFRLGENREQSGNLAGAADAYVKLPILYAHPEWVRLGLLHAGLVYERLAQPAKAQRFFRELVQQHAGSEEAKAAEPHLRDG